MGTCVGVSSCRISSSFVVDLPKYICFQRLFVVGVCCLDPTTDTSTTSNQGTNSTTTPKSMETTSQTTNRKILSIATPHVELLTTEASTEATTVAATSSTTWATTTTATTSAAASTTQRAASKRQCGQVMTAFNRIVGGELSEPGQWPWMAAVYLISGTGVEYHCGGSLISDQYILTAAHCTRDRNEQRYRHAGYGVSTQ